MRFKSLGKILDFLSPPTKITFTLSEPLTQELCTDIQKTLGTKEDVTTTNYTVLGKFYRHIVQVRVGNRQKFKKNILKLRKKHPNIAIASESTSYKKYIWTRGMWILGTLMLIWKLIDMIWPS